MAKDLYTVLGVAKDAKDDDIQKAFRRQAKKYHPDLNPGDKKAEDRFKELNAAYDILGDTTKRGRYDRGEIDASGTEIRQNPFARGGGFRGGFNPGAGAGAGGGGAQSFAFEDLSDLFGGIFGGARGGGAGGNAGFGGGFGGAGQRGFQAPPEDSRFSLEVDFLDAAVGTKKRLTLPTGKALDVTIPPGISDGQTIRLKGQGGSGPGPAGDALIEVKVREHPLFKRDGNDIRLEFPISLTEAVLGGKVEVPTIHGAVTVTVPKGANTGRTLRLKGKGIAGNKRTPAGDQYVKLMVMLPPSGDADLEQFIRTWGPKHPYDPRADVEKS